MIKLLALDLDGTVLDSRGNVPDANRKAIAEAERHGVLVTIASGRRFRDARPVGIDLNLNAPLITHNGALLKYAESLESVAAALLDTETALEVLRVGRSYGGTGLVSADPHGKGTMLYERIAEQNEPFNKYIRWAESMHGDEASEAVIRVDSLESSVSDHEVIHISFSGRCRGMEDLATILSAELGDTITLLATIYPKLDFTLLDVLPPGASKGSGVSKLAAINGISQAEIMVIGDNFNDLEMLEIAGTPVVMANADPSLRERPEFYTTLSNDESGVAAAINRYILNGDNN
jgi:Cof subfamily protein (haloacid dehalogenase superfamily)